MAVYSLGRPFPTFFFEIGLFLLEQQPLLFYIGAASLYAATPAGYNQKQQDLSTTSHHHPFLICFPLLGWVPFPVSLLSLSSPSFLWKEKNLFPSSRSLSPTRPPPCQASTARASPLQEPSPPRLGATPMLTGTADFLSDCSLLILDPKIAPPAPSFPLTLVIDWWCDSCLASLQPVLGRASCRASEAGALHAGAADMQPAAQPR